MGDVPQRGGWGGECTTQGDLFVWCLVRPRGLLSGLMPRAGPRCVPTGSQPMTAKAEEVGIPLWCRVPCFLWHDKAVEAVTGLGPSSASVNDPSAKLQPWRSAVTFARLPTFVSLEKPRWWCGRPPDSWRCGLLCCGGDSDRPCGWVHGGCGPSGAMLRRRVVPGSWWGTPLRAPPLGLGEALAGWGDPTC